ncbi:MAG: hypothetical protein HXS47_06435 [Theionarchaea archaeon]|nr:hypothetical protein [Theionarchaea archaeon]
MNLLSRWEIGGVVFVIIAGSFFHFLYELSGSWAPVGIIAAVNESVWEHLKLGFWPASMYSLIEYPVLTKNTENFIMGRTACIVSIPLSIVILFYMYTGILGQNYFILDIVIFIVSVIVGGIISYRIMISTKSLSAWNWVAIVCIVILAVLFGVFTFYPPHIFLFQDPVTGGYGIQSIILMM